MDLLSIILRHSDRLYSLTAVMTFAIPFPHPSFLQSSFNFFSDHRFPYQASACSAADHPIHCISFPSPWCLHTQHHLHIKWCRSSRSIPFTAAASCAKPAADFFPHNTFPSMVTLACISHIICIDERFHIIGCSFISFVMFVLCLHAHATSSASSFILFLA